MKAFTDVEISFESGGIVDVDEYLSFTIRADLNYKNEIGDKNKSGTFQLDI